ncbi:MAG: ParB N-terminal domain-containing protein [Oscillospiraceae bacterium]|nr:ParB N-terminal domain-containing protein [Oscillospiraceae bacterium]
MDSDNFEKEEVLKEWNFDSIEKEEPLENWSLNDEGMEEFAEKEDFNIDYTPNSAALKPETGDVFLDTIANFSNELQYIDLPDLVDIGSSINFFPSPSDEELLDLMESLEIFGVLSPLTVIKCKDSDKYTVVSGRSRLAALKKLYDQSFDSNYYRIPCRVLDPATDPSIIQGIVLSTNLTYRKMPKDTQIKAVLALDAALSKNKKYKNQMNLTDIIAKKMDISRTNTNTLRGFKNLSDNALDLLYNDYMSREAARILSLVKDKETQDILIGKLGRQINNVSLLKDMIASPSKKENKNSFDIKVASPDSVRDQLEINRKIKKAEQTVPEYTTITLRVNHIELEQLLTDLSYIRAGMAKKHKTTKNGEINKYLSVNLSDVQMDLYLRNGFVTQETIDLIKSDDYNKITTFELA